MASVHRDRVLRNGRPRSPFWYASFKGADGRWKFKSTKALDEGKALDIARKWEVAAIKARQGELIEDQARKVLNQMLEHVGETQISSLSVRDHFNQVLSAKDLSVAPGSFGKYQRVARSFLVSLGEKADKRLDLVTPSDIQRFLEREYREGRKATTVNQSLKIVRVFFTKARRLGLITNSPADAVESLRAKTKERGIFTREQLAALYTAADTEWRGMILLGCYCGMRIMDAASLTWSNIDLEADLITYFPGKSRDQQMLKVPISGELREHLASLDRPKRPEAAIFPALSKFSRPGDKNGPSQQFLDLVRRIGIDPYDGDGAPGSRLSRRTPVFSFHSLRHQFVSSLAAVDVPEEIRCQLSGHKSKSVHAQYTHHELQTLRDAVGKISRIQGS